MKMRAVVMAWALTFAAAAGAMAQSSVPGPGMRDGVVAEVDSAAGVVKLQDGRMYRVASGTELVFKGVRPGNYVTINGLSVSAASPGRAIPRRRRALTSSAAARPWRARHGPGRRVH